MLKELRPSELKKYENRHNKFIGYSYMRYEHTAGEIPYRKGIFQEAIEYKSLTFLDMTERDRYYAVKTVEKKKITTGELAHSFVISENVKHPFNGWTYEKVDLHGRIGILKFKGVEIFLFIQRQLTKKRIDKDNPFSVRKLTNNDDAWMRLDLTGMSANQVRKPLVEDNRRLEAKVESLTHQLEVKNAIVEQYESREKQREKKKRKAAVRTQDRKAPEKRHAKTRKRSGKSRR